MSYKDANGELALHYLTTTELQATNAEAIKTAFDFAIGDHSLNKQDMVGLATDGASVMRGSQTGVSTCLKEEIEHLIANHCMAHRLQLVA